MSIRKTITELGDAVAWMNLVFLRYGTKDTQELRCLLMDEHRGITDLLTSPERDYDSKQEEISRRVREFRKGVRDLTYPMAFTGEFDKYGVKISIKPKVFETEAIRQIRSRMALEYLGLI